MEDKSILKNTDTIDVNATYINDCIKEVCLNGDSLTKYKRMIEKQYGAEFYQKCSNFVKGIRLSVKRKKFTQTSLTNLRYLANEINIRPDTIDAIVNYYTKTFIDEQKKIEEETTLMSTNAEEESKKLELEEERKKEEERERKAEERRKRVEERRREKEREEKRLREEQFKLLKKEEEETKRKEEEDDKKGAIGCGIIIAIIIALRLVSSSESFEEVLGIIIVFGFIGFIYYIFKD